ncbi:aminoglycoside phosphotransferase family protein [Streptomyces sp. NBC_00280]|uniref:aminoglycoside phosphotransferase family protein n=1 Tax=Streptomyces sp. NBC_00280 TaxID=2975699 RepID=UPI002F9106BA
MTDAAPPPPGLQAWAQRQVGPITAVRDVSHPRPGSRVWQLDLGGRPDVFLKAALGPVAYRRESFAYRHAVPALGPGAAPQLIESSAQHLGLLMTGIPGRPLAELDVPPAVRHEAYRQAGVLLARLHQAGELRGEHRTEAEESLRRTAHGAEKHLAAAGDRVSGAERRLVLRLAEELLVLGPVPLGFLHGDAWERNMLWSGRRSAWVDFERARFGAVVQDLVAMYCGAWSEEPGLRPAFFRGFGRELSAQEEHALTCLSALDAVSCLGWAPGQGDLQVAARGRRTLDRLMGAYA